MKILLFLICLTISQYIYAQTPEILPLWPGTPPINTIQHEKPEELENRESDRNELGFNRAYWHVSEPNITVYLPDQDKATGAAIVIYPGGGYVKVTIDKEGYDVAKVLNSHGIAAIVVKYRTWPVHDPMKGDNTDKTKLDAIFADGLRAVQITRYHAKKWNIDPEKIGVMGFSAGGNLACNVSILGNAGDPAAADPVARVSSHPDYAVLVYPWLINITDEMIPNPFPPTFLIQAADDKTTPALKSTHLYRLLLEQNTPAEMHVYLKGGHGFGLGVKGGPVTSWPTRLIDWMDVMGISKK